MKIATVAGRPSGQAAPAAGSEVAAIGPGLSESEASAAAAAGD